MISPYKELLNTIVLLTVDKFDPEMAATLSSGMMKMTSNTTNLPTPKTCKN